MQVFHSIVRKIPSFTNLCRTLIQVSVYTTSIFLIQVTTHIHFTSFFPPFNDLTNPSRQKEHKMILIHQNAVVHRKVKTCQTNSLPICQGAVFMAAKFEVFPTLSLKTFTHFTFPLELIKQTHSLYLLSPFILTNQTSTMGNNQLILDIFRSLLKTPY